MTKKNFSTRVHSKLNSTLKQEFLLSRDKNTNYLNRRIKSKIKPLSSKVESSLLKRIKLSHYKNVKVIDKIIYDEKQF